MQARQTISTEEDEEASLFLRLGLWFSFPLARTPRPPVNKPASPDLCDPGGPAHSRRRDSRREVSRGRTRAPRKRATTAGGGRCARLRLIAEPQRGGRLGGSLVLPSASGDAATQA